MTDSLSRAEDWLNEVIDPSTQDEPEHQEREEESKEEDSNESR